MKASQIFSICALSLLTALQSFPAHASSLVCEPSELIAVFRANTAMKASCLPAADQKEILQSNDIVFTRYWDQSPSKSIVTRIVNEAQRLNGGIFTPFHSFAVDVDENFRILGQQVYDSDLKKPKVIIQEPTNVSLYAHEMGHIIGNTPINGGTWYGAYFKAVPNPCHITCYSRSGYDQGRRNEEFAEVASAYLTYPQLLLKGGDSCRRAYQFFRTNIYPKADPSCGKIVVIPKPVVIPAKPVVVEAKPTVVEAKPAVVAAKPDTVATPAPAAKPAANVKPAVTTETKPVVTPLNAKPSVAIPAPVLAKPETAAKPATTATPAAKPVAAPSAKPAEAAKTAATAAPTKKAAVETTAASSVTKK